MLTILTASHRNLSGLRSLAAEIVPHLASGLRWVIKDSGSCPATSAWAATSLACEPGISFDASPDNGIYDALNRGLTHVTTDYYLVVGSDDSLDGVRLAEVARTLDEKSPEPPPDLLTFPVRTAKGLWRRKRYRPLWVSSSSLFTTHSVGTLIRSSLHSQIGPYDTRYRILADSLFLRRAWMDGARFEHREGPVLGTFNLGGISSVEHGRRMVETYSYLVEIGSSKWLQAFLLCLRLLRYRPTSLL